MITVILKDGTEVTVNEGNELVPYSPHGKYDLMVAIYRRDVQAWTMGRMTSMRVGDFFRKLDMPESADHAFLVTKAPVVRGWGRQEGYAVKDPDIVLEGVTLMQLSKLPPVQARRLIEGPKANQEVITSHTRLLLEN